jgi:hypothetical protein
MTTRDGREIIEELSTEGEEVAKVENVNKGQRKDLEIKLQH